MIGPPRGPIILAPDDPPDAFPEPGHAMREPDGLLAVGGDLSSERLLAAYRRGIFPWFSDGEPILWWSPDPRCVFRPGQVRVARRLRRTLRSSPVRVRINTAFDDVITGCAGPRSYTEETWITSEMKRAYCRLHTSGVAHSIEAWDGERLVGGLYGLAIGGVFFGESMFSATRDASKIILVHLSRWLEKQKFGLIDCQVASAHLISMGAILMPRSDFVEELGPLCARSHDRTLWESGREIGF
ncbi:MAG: leucyl/phenylalanyl-tRNA--protein transferase [Pseudomonadota bacterium]